MSSSNKFGTAPVFLTAISTILGAIMFLRFGYAVGNIGFFGTLIIILIGHLVTIPTAMSIAEIATNQRVQGGGEYYIISRSFGLIIGATIGISLFLSQAISVAFYVIAFGESFVPLLKWIATNYHIVLPDKRLITIPATIMLSAVVLWKGADLGVKLLYIVVATLFVSLAMFFAGNTGYAESADFQILLKTVDNPDSFFLVFAICFPAFTGMTAGVGLSGDLRNPQKSIPLGTLLATFSGMVIYILIAYKLAVSASPENLATDQLVMSKIATWGPIIPLGLAAATISSALGSILVAPRTLQAIGEDAVIPVKGWGKWLAKGKGNKNEPFNASVVVTVIALVFVILGDVDFVAQVISMFFMVTYGAICLISFIEHFAADPSYRPTFKSRWYISLFGAAMCGWLMFKMNFGYAVLAITLMVILYFVLMKFNHEKRGLSKVVQGAIFQMSRQIHVFLQGSRKHGTDSWRPSVICITEASFHRLAAFDILRWISHRYGFGTYIHFIKGYFSKAMADNSKATLARLIHLADLSDSNVYVDTIVSPSFTTAVTQIIQLPGISGKENNMVLFEFNKDAPDEDINRITENYALIASAGFDICVLASSDRAFGYKKEIHVWLSQGDYENASLMVIMAYIIFGHPDWKGSEIKIFSTVSDSEMTEQGAKLKEMIRTGRIPISERNLEIIPSSKGMDRRILIKEKSCDADLIILGFRGEAVKRLGSDMFKGYEGVGNILFVNTVKDIGLIANDYAPAQEEPSDDQDRNNARLVKEGH